MKIAKICILSLIFLLPLAAQAQEYVGDETCGRCHANMPEEGFFDNYRDSGHPYKLNKVVDGEPPTWPHTEAPPLPMVFGEQLEWGDVSYVIGGFYWKARFIDLNGFIYTGSDTDKTQWNLQDETWAGYHAGEEDKPYNCGRCHTTGYDAEGGNQDDLEGLIGTWTEPGIRCEACHGPSSEHAAAPNEASPPGGIDCAGCHYRDSEFRMPWKGGFTRHHQQGEDLSHSPHQQLGCNTCHDPHKSTLYELGGLKDAATCTNCHGDQTKIDLHEELVCIDCHMPFMGKSAIKRNDFTGDIRGHLFNIVTDPIMAAANTDTVDGSIFWHQEEDGSAGATLDYVCMSCHVEGDIDELAAWADNIHDNHPTGVSDEVVLPIRTALSEAYPNPFNSSASISYSLSVAGEVQVNLIDMGGRTIDILAQGHHAAGKYQTSIEAKNLPAGPYFVQLQTEGLQLYKKVILLK